MTQSRLCNNDNKDNENNVMCASMLEFFDGLLECQILWYMGGNVTTRRDTWSKKICSLGCHDIREGVTLRRMIWQKLGCFTYNRCGSFIPYQFDYKYQSVVLSSSTWHLEAQNKLLSCFKVNDHIHHHNEPNHFNWTKHLGWFTRGPKSQVQFILASSNFWTSEKPLKYK